MKIRECNKISGLGVVALALVSVFSTLCWAAVDHRAPSPKLTPKLTDDTAIYDELREVDTPKQAAPDFDGDLDRLSAAEHRYTENLPLLTGQAGRIAKPAKRIEDRAQKKARQLAAPVSAEE